MELIRYKNIVIKAQTMAVFINLWQPYIHICRQIIDRLFHLTPSHAAPDTAMSIY